MGTPSLWWIRQISVGETVIVIVGFEDLLLTISRKIDEGVEVVETGSLLIARRVLFLIRLI